MDAGAAGVLDVIRTLLSAYFPGGGLGVALSALLVVSVLALWGKYKDELKKLTGPWFSGHSVLVVTVFLFPAAWLLDARRLLALIVLTLCVVAYFAVRKWRRQLLVPRRNRLGGVATAAVLVLIGYLVDGVLEERRRASVDVAFLLPPNASEPEKLFPRLRKSLHASVKGVDRVRIVPEKHQELANHGVDRSGTASYRTADGLQPKVFIENIVRGAREDEVKVLVRLFQANKLGDRLDRIAWDFDPPPRSAAGLDGIAIYSYFEVITFLASKDVLKLTPDARQAIRRNTLVEYRDFLTLSAPECPVHAELKKRIAGGGVAKDEDIVALLKASCEELAPGEAASTAHRRELDLLRMQSTADFIE